MPNKSRDAPAKPIDVYVLQLTERGVDATYVSYACTIEVHEDCPGKVVRMSDGAYVRCRCPDCNHPQPRLR